ncbi:MAG: ankyrin repeat domain-containing protein [Candidatus Cloacimonetes bacterium]|nr:ankyrin repeat domain-containing protein [Candidatus Cloacimonadota bacterium]
MTWQGILELDEIKSLYFKPPRQAVAFCMEAMQSAASKKEGRMAAAWGRHAWNNSIRDKSAAQRIDCIYQTLRTLNDNHLWVHCSDFALALCAAGLKQHNPILVYEGTLSLFEHAQHTGMILGYRHCLRHKSYLEDHKMPLNRDIPEHIKQCETLDPANVEDELENPFCLAIEDNNFELALLLIKKGHPLNSTTFCDHSALHKACLKSNLEAFRFLICEGLNPYKKDLNAKLALELAPDGPDWKELWQNMHSVPSLTHST